MIMAMIPALADEVTKLKGIEYVLDNTRKTASVVSGLSLSGPVSIPESITKNGVTYKVISIKSAAFSGCDGLTSIIIGNSVTNIEDNAFSSCPDLTSVTIGTSVRRIGEHAFYDCPNLKEVHITDIAAWCGISFNKSYANPLNYAADLYLRDELITDIVIPEGVEYINAYVFEGYHKLSSVSFPSSLKGVRKAAFRKCTAIQSVILPGSVKTIGTMAFSGCTGLTYLDIPNSVNSIAEAAFYNCRGLTSVTIPESVIKIGDSAFEECQGLTSVYIPNSVTSIGVKAFYWCLKLESVEIGENVTEIGERAFKDTKVMNPIIHAYTPPEIKYCEREYWPNSGNPKEHDYGDPPFDKEAFEDGALYIPMGSYQDYRHAEVWKDFKNMWPIGTSGIKDSTDADDAVTINGNTISVDAKVGTSVNIYSVDGVLRYQGDGSAEVALPSGLYILRIGSKSRHIQF